MMKKETNHRKKKKRISEMMAKPQCIPIKEMMGWYSFLANHGGDFSLYQDDYQDGHEDGRWYS